MHLLKSNHARNIAENRWGTGGTHAYRTNTKGAFYFSCSGHGGYVIDSRILTPEQLEKVRPHSEVVKATYYLKFGKAKLWHDLRQRNMRVYSSSDQEEFDILLFEEDCAWSLVQLFTDIRSKAFSVTDDELAEIADRYYNEWFNPDSPIVQSRAIWAEKRHTGDPDLITAALQTDAKIGDEPIICVATAARKYHFVLDYDQSITQQVHGTERLLSSIEIQVPSNITTSIYQQPTQAQIAALAHNKSLRG